MWLKGQDALTFGCWNSSVLQLPRQLQDRLGKFGVIAGSTGVSQFDHHVEHSRLLVQDEPRCHDRPADNIGEELFLDRVHGSHRGVRSDLIEEELQSTLEMGGVDQTS